VSFCSLLVSELLCDARRGDDPLAHRIVDYLGQRMEAKLEHDLSSVRFNRPDGDSQMRGDLLVRFPFCQEANDFKLAGSCSRACPLPMLMPATSLEKSLFRRLVVRYDRSLTIYGAFFHIACFMIVLRRVVQ